MANSIGHARLPYPIRKARYTCEIPFIDADGDPTDPTTPDTELSIDGAAFADAAEEVTTITGSNGAGYITLSGAETDGSLVIGCAKVASGPKATLFSLHPRDLPILSSGTLSAGSAGGGTLGTILGYDVTGCFIRTTGGTGGGGTGGANNQARRIITYTPSTGAFTVAPNWETTPDNTTTYDVLLPDGSTFGALKAVNPTTAGRTLDVSAGGEAGVDWGNVGSPTTTVGLSGTTVKTATDVETDTADIQTRLPAALVTGRIDASVGEMAASVLNAAAIAPGAIAASKFAAGAIDAAALAADAVAEIADGVWDEATSGHTTAGTFGKLLADVLADTNELQTDWANGGRLDLLVDAILEDTGTTLDGRIPAALVGGKIDANVGSKTVGLALTAQEKADVNAEVLDVVNTDTFAEPGQEAPGATVSLVKKIGYLYKFLRNKITQTSTELKVYADDASTVDQKATVSDDATTYTRGEIGAGP